MLVCILEADTREDQPRLVVIGTIDMSSRRWNVVDDTSHRAMQARIGREVNTTATSSENRHMGHC